MEKQKVMDRGKALEPPESDSSGEEMDYTSYADPVLDHQRAL